MKLLNVTPCAQAAGRPSACTRVAGVRPGGDTVSLVNNVIRTEVRVDGPDLRPEFSGKLDPFTFSRYSQI